MRLVSIVATLVCIAAIAPPARASDDPAADLEDCHEAVRTRSWKKGGQLYERLLAEHTGSPVLLAERLAIEDDLQLCAFNLGRKPPSGEELFGVSVKKFSASTRRIDFEFEKGLDDPMWEETSSAFKMLPVRFEDAVEIVAPIEGRKTKIPHRIHMRALIGFSPEEGGGYLLLPAFNMSFGSTDWDAIGRASTVVRHYHRIFRLGGDEPELLQDDFYWSGNRTDTECKWAKVSQKGEVLKIEVDGCTSISTRDRSHESGFVALQLHWEHGDWRGGLRGEDDGGGPPKESPSIALSATVDRQYLIKRIAQYEDEAFRVWKEKVYDRNAVLPEWLRTDAAPATTESAPLPGDVPEEQRAAVRAFLAKAWRGDLEQPELDLVAIGPVAGQGGRLLGGVHLWVRGAAARAEEELTALIAEAPKLATAWIWRAAIRLTRRDFEGTLTDVNAALTLAPTDPGAHQLRAQVHLRQGDLDAASEALLAARTAGAWNATLEELAGGVTAARRGPHWKQTHRKKSRNFEVTTDHSAKMAQDVANDLEQALRIFTRYFRPFPETRREARVFVFSSRDAYLEDAKELGAGLEHSAGAYLPRLGVLVIWMPADRDDFGATVRHEGFHQYVHNFAENLPLWFNEGYAEHFGNAQFGTGRVQYDITSFRYAKRVARLHGDFVSVEELMRMPRDEFMANASVHYVQAWTLVRFLAETKEAEYRGILGDYFEALVAGRSSDEAFDEVVKPNIDTLEIAFRLYFMKLYVDADD